MQKKPKKARSDKEDALHMFSKCPLCDHAYSNRGMTMIKDNGGAKTIHISCGECSSAILAFLMMTPAGISAVATVTDLTSRDAVRVADCLEIEEDDVFALYGVLQSRKNLFDILK